MRKFVATFIFIAGIFAAYSQDSEVLQDFGIDTYYSVEETKNTLFSQLEVKATGISNLIINESFSNIDDLNWLSEIAKKNKVLLIGETHYARYIGNIIARVFFAINTYDYYSTIFIEQPYSITEFINYYFTIEDDKMAEVFFKNELNKYVGTEEDSIFYTQIRRWNQMNKNEPLSVGATDLEFNAKRTLNDIIKPYLYELRNIDKNEIDTLISLGLTNDFFSQIAPLIEIARNEKTKGQYPFLDYSYIENILKNLKSTQRSYESDFNKNRHQAILRNLTDSNFFGKKLIDSKVMLYGGGNHMKTKSIMSDDEDALSEGFFLTNEFDATKGRTYSIMLDGMGVYSLDKMSAKSLDKCIKQGSQYTKIVNRLKGAYDAGLLDSQKPYFLFFTRNDFEKLIAGLSYAQNNNAILILDESWNTIIQFIDTLSEEERNLFEKIIREKSMFDSYVFVPQSPIVTAKYK